MTKRILEQYPGSDYDSNREQSGNQPGERPAPAQIDQQMPPADYEPRKANRLRRTVIAIGASAAAVVAAGGILAFGLKGSGDKETPQPRPAATAGVAPGETVGSEPTPESTEVDTTLGWTPEEFPYFIDGETYNGVAELEAAYGISVDKYPDGEAIATKLIDNVNVWINSIDTAEDNEVRYKDYSDLNYARNAAVANNLAGPAWSEVLTTDELETGEVVVNPDTWVMTLTNLHLQNIQDSAQARLRPKDDPRYAADHHAGYRLDNTEVHVDNYKGETAFTLKLTFDPERRNEVVYANVTMKQVAGKNSEKFWKVISWQDKTQKEVSGQNETSEE